MMERASMQQLSIPIGGKRERIIRTQVESISDVAGKIHNMQSSTSSALVLGCLAVLLGLVLQVSASKDDSIVVSEDMEKRGGGDKWNKAAFNDYAHLRFGRSDPALVSVDEMSPIYRYPPIYGMAEKRASFGGGDYGHMRFGRRVPSFTDYGHLRFG
ncbi:hypothetical protein BV898_08217 [Hypsibius exemplaris]|uniref:Uncharacterized protein n=1 Tax=Hypsibius exemplaris TaxID=2072580 RepID=A0A1W0WRD7_HYPEX|nr:hypothetical protein BV898_08217 [Hypsibius exemplaris]